MYNIIMATKPDFNKFERSRFGGDGFIYKRSNPILNTKRVCKEKIFKQTCLVYTNKEIQDIN